MAGRARVTLIDAMLDPARAGDLLVFEDDLSGLAPESPSAHQMAAVGAVELLRMLYPALRSVPITLLAVAVDSASVGLELSPALAARMPGLVEEVLRRLGAACDPPRGRSSGGLRRQQAECGLQFAAGMGVALTRGRVGAAPVHPAGLVVTA